MAVLALVLIAAWLAVTTVVRAVIQARWTGQVRVIRFQDRSGAARWAGIVSTVGFVCMVAAPVAELAGMDPWAALDRAPLRAAGAVLVVLGGAGSFAAQLAMGASWRADVDPDARTELVTTGPFRLVRNPVFTATATVSAGLALMVPNPIALAMLVANLTGLQVQVRMVEEPHLRRVHGDAYERYAARTGRFLPWLGRARGQNSVR